MIIKSIEWFSDLLQNPGRPKWSERLKKWTKYSNITENTEIIWYLASFTLWHLRLHEKLFIDILPSDLIPFFLMAIPWMLCCFWISGFRTFSLSLPHILHWIKIWALRTPIHNSNIFCLEEFHDYHSPVTWGIVLHGNGRLLSWISQHREDIIFYKLFINSCIYFSL